MSTTVGNGLTVDGTVKASQATQAGEAVVLGEDGLVPASLVASKGAGGVAMLPHFFSTYKSIGRFKVSGWGSTTSSYKTFSEVDGLEIISYKYGKILYSGCTMPNKSSSSDKYRGQVMVGGNTLNNVLTDVLNSVRTNIRGNASFSVIVTTSSDSVCGYTDVDVNISDEGISLVSAVSWPDIYCYGPSSTSPSSATIIMRIANLTIPDEGWY